MFQVGRYAFSSQRIPVLLAPMSGVTDAPFRKQVEKFGASATITEMVAGEELVSGGRDAQQRLTRSNSDATKTPFIVQLVGREPDPMRRGAIIARQAGAEIIDINMGCPSRRVTGGLSGSALMRDLERAESIIEAVLEGAGDVPVTLKMRLGWDRETLNAPELAKIAERLGVKMLTVHGRTRQDFYEGSADWAAIRDVVAATDLPVVANGDIADVDTARQALALSGAHAVMVGRAATGKAWLPAALELALATNTTLKIPSLEIQIESLIEQAEDCIALYGKRVGIRTVRKHVSAAFDFWVETQASELEHLLHRKALACRADSVEALRDSLNSLTKERLKVNA